MPKKQGNTVYLLADEGSGVTDDGKVVNAEVEKSGTDHVVSKNAPVEKSDKVEPETFDKDYVKSIRDEAASWRTKLREKEAAFEEAMAKLKAFEDAQLSAEEKAARDFEEAKTRASSMESKAREAELRYQLAIAAREEGISDLKAAVKLADRELIEYDSAGNITNLPDVIENLRSEYSSLFSKTASAPNTGVTNPAKPPAAKKWTRQDLASLSPEKRVELMQSGALNDLLGRKGG
jgi:hypothetical protein